MKGYDMSYKEEEYKTNQKIWIYNRTLEDHFTPHVSRFKITRQAATGESGWPQCWDDRMTEWVDKIAIYLESKSDGIMLYRFGNYYNLGYFYFPYYILEPVEESWENLLLELTILYAWERVFTKKEKANIMTLIYRGPALTTELTVKEVISIALEDNRR